MENFDIIFDNGGGITIQTDDYCHHYTSPNQAADDINTILTSNHYTEQWDGNEPEHRIFYDRQAECNGHYRWLTDGDVIAAIGDIEKEDREDWLYEISGNAERKFFTSLFEMRDRAAV